MKKLSYLLMLAVMAVAMPACGSDDDDEQVQVDPFETSCWQSVETNAKGKPLVSVQFMPHRQCVVCLYFFSNDLPKELEMKYKRMGEKVSLIQSSGACAYGIFSGDTLNLTIGTETYTLLQTRL